MSGIEVNLLFARCSVVRYPLNAPMLSGISVMLFVGIVRLVNLVRYEISVGIVHDIPLAVSEIVVTRPLVQLTPYRVHIEAKFPRLVLLLRLFPFVLLKRETSATQSLTGTPTAAEHIPVVITVVTLPPQALVCGLYAIDLLDKNVVRLVGYSMTKQLFLISHHVIFVSPVKFAGSAESVLLLI